MDVSQLIRYRAYKQYMLKTFPISTSCPKKAAKYPNPYPSMRGNAFELLFELVTTTKKITKKDFSERFIQAYKNISRIRRWKEIRRQDCQTYYCVSLTAEDYRKIVSASKKLLSHTCVISRSHEFKYLEVRNTALEVNSIFAFYNETGIWLSIQRPMIIYDVDSLADLYKAALDGFLLQAISFQKERKLTKTFVKTLLLFSHVSHKFFSVLRPLHLGIMTKEYVANEFYYYKNACTNYPQPLGRLIRKPSFSFNGIAARPDFLLRKGILELKTSQKPTNAECLQALSYLLFAQFQENRSCYGEIKSVSIYYVSLDYILVINMKDFDIGEAMLKKIRSITERFKRDYLKPKKVLQRGE